ncbi:MAG: DUF378 domain-containing protein [Acetobacteraceae bacterium]|nr:DUF378 domain-containing protein [Acetobacteraceae bacterium]MBV8526062.1 DUF378 domain-containing protein [Acetobacteraceae bacterium]
MKPVNLIAQALLVIGGLNWGLVGLFRWDLVAALFGDGSILSRLVYVVVGACALWQLGRLLVARDSSRDAWDAA